MSLTSNVPVTWEMLQRAVKSANAQIDHCEKLLRDHHNERGWLVRGFQQASAEVINVFGVARQLGFVAPDKVTCPDTHECLEDGDAAARCMNSKAWIHRASTMVLETTLEKARDAVDLMKDAVWWEASNQTQQLADGMRVGDFTIGQRPATDARVLQLFKTTLATKTDDDLQTLDREMQTTKTRAGLWKRYLEGRKWAAVQGEIAKRKRTEFFAVLRRPEVYVMCLYLGLLMWCGIQSGKYIWPEADLPPPPPPPTRNADSWTLYKYTRDCHDDAHFHDVAERMQPGDFQWGHFSGNLSNLHNSKVPYLDFYDPGMWEVHPTKEKMAVLAHWRRHSPAAKMYDHDAALMHLPPIASRDFDEDVIHMGHGSKLGNLRPTRPDGFVHVTRITVDAVDGEACGDRTECLMASGLGIVEDPNPYLVCNPDSPTKKDGARATVTFEQTLAYNGQPYGAKKFTKQVMCTNADPPGYEKRHPTWPKLTLCSPRK